MTAKIETYTAKGKWGWRLRLDGGTIEHSEPATFPTAAAALDDARADTHRMMEALGIVEATAPPPAPPPVPAKAITAVRESADAIAGRRRLDFDFNFPASRWASEIPDGSGWAGAAVSDPAVRSLNLTDLPPATAVTIVVTPADATPLVRRTVTTAGAVTNTTPPPGPPILGKAIYLEPHGNDSAAGTIDAPLATYEHALAVADPIARAGLVVTIVSTDEWRVTTPWTVPTGLAGSIKLAPWRGRSTPTVKGSKVVTGFARQTDGTLRCSGKFALPLSPIPSAWANTGVGEMAQRREVVYLNGQRLAQYLSRSELLAAPSGFTVDSNALWIKTAADPATMLVEVAQADAVFRAWNVDGLSIDGFVFEHGCGSIQSGGVDLAGCRNLTLSHVTARGFNWTALGFYHGDGFRPFEGGNTLTDVTFDDNGACGLAAFQVKGFTGRRCRGTRNGWRDLRGGNIAQHESAVAKLLWCDDADLDEMLAVGNETTAVWFDYGNRRCSLTNSHIADNGSDGLHCEASYGPMVATNNTIKRCAKRTGRGGIVCSQQERLTLGGNDVYGNGGRGQVCITGAGQLRDGLFGNRGMAMHDMRIAEQGGSPAIFANGIPDLALATTSSGGVPLAPYDGKVNRFDVGSRFELENGPPSALAAWQGRVNSDRDAIVAALIFPAGYALPDGRQLAA